MFNGAGSCRDRHYRRVPFERLVRFGMSIGLPDGRHGMCLALAPGISAPTTRATQERPPRSGGRFWFVQFEELVWAHEVSGAKWQALTRSMQPTTMMPVWQCDECPRAQRQRDLPRPTRHSTRHSSDSLCPLPTIRVKRLYSRPGSSGPRSGTADDPTWLRNRNGILMTYPNYDKDITTHGIYQLIVIGLIAHTCIEATVPSPPSAATTLRSSMTPSRIFECDDARLLHCH